MPSPPPPSPPPGSEFALIRRHFAGADAGAGVDLGIGDDAALLRVPAGAQLVVSTDTLVAGRHFPDDTAARDVGHKALAVNLSDLAAMGAAPLGCLLALTLPAVDDGWLADFAAGFKALAQAAGCPLVGGDTTRGSLAIGVTVLGVVPSGHALLRAGGRPGDVVAVTGTLGDAALALWLLQRGRFDSADPDHAWLRRRLDAPVPRLAAGTRLREERLAHAGLDLSDGLAGDLRHVLDASRVDGVIEPHRLPRSASFEAVADAQGLSDAARQALMMTGGDDYELLLCLPPDAFEPARAALGALDLGLTAVGELASRAGPRGAALVLRDAVGAERPFDGRGYDHFAAADPGA